MIVELLGPPGAGKTTVAQALEQELTRRGRSVTVATRGSDALTPRGDRLRTKASLVVAEVVRRPGSSLRAARELARSHQPGTVELLRRLVAWLVAQRLVGRGRAASGDLILDEGGLQALWSVGLCGDHRGMLRAWGARPDQWHVPEVVVVLAPPLAELQARLQGRQQPHSRTERLHGTERLASLRRGREVTGEIADALPTIGLSPAAVIRLDGTGTPHDLACLIASQVLDLDVAYS